MTFLSKKWALYIVAPAILLSGCTDIFSNTQKAEEKPWQAVTQYTGPADKICDGVTIETRYPEGVSYKMRASQNYADIALEIFEGYNLQTSKRERMWKISTVTETRLRDFYHDHDIDAGHLVNNPDVIKLTACAKKTNVLDFIPN